MRNEISWTVIALGLAVGATAFAGVIERGRQIYHLPERVEKLDTKTREQLEKLRIQRAELERQIIGIDEATRRSKADFEARDAKRQADLESQLARLNGERNALSAEIAQSEAGLALRLNAIESQRANTAARLRRWLWISGVVAVVGVLRRPLGRVLALVVIRCLAPAPRWIKHPGATTP